MNETRSATVFPWTKDREVEAAATVSVGGVNVTVMGRFAPAEYTRPVFAAVSSAVRSSVDEPATALGLPVSVSVQAIDPFDATVGEPNCAVNPLGRPETTLMLALPVPLVAEAGQAAFPCNVPGPPVCPTYSLRAPLTATAKPPTGVAVTVSVAVESDCI